MVGNNKSFADLGFLISCSNRASFFSGARQLPSFSSILTEVCFIKNGSGSVRHVGLVVGEFALASLIRAKLLELQCDCRMYYRGLSAWCWSRTLR